MTFDVNKGFKVRNGQANVHNIQPQVKSYHYAHTSFKNTPHDPNQKPEIHKNQRFGMEKCGKNNTVGNRKMIENDIERIRKGEADIKTVKIKNKEMTQFKLDNGRIYRAEAIKVAGDKKEVTLYPVKGTGLARLNQKESHALGHLNEHGYTTKSRSTMINSGVKPKEFNKALSVWENNSGKNVSKDDIRKWKKEYQSEHHQQKSAKNSKSNQKPLLSNSKTDTKQKTV